MFPFIMKQTPPNILLSENPLRRVRIERTRSCKT